VRVTVFSCVPDLSSTELGPAADGSSGRNTGRVVRPAVRPRTSEERPAPRRTHILIGKTCNLKKNPASFFKFMAYRRLALPRFTTIGTDRKPGASFDRESSATATGRAVSAELSAYQHPAQHAVKCAEEPPTRIVSWQSQGADGPTRRSSSVSRGILDGATANSVAADPHGPLQDDQAVKTKLLTENCLWGLDQGLGLAPARCSREPAACTALHHGSAGSRVGWTSLPCTPNAAHFNGNTRSGR
jgi:hypothetical protein